MTEIAVHGEKIAYTGIHGGMIDLRCAIDADLEFETGGLEKLDANVGEPRAPILATIRIELRDVLDRDGRLLLSTAYADPC